MCVAGDWTLESREEKGGVVKAGDLFFLTKDCTVRIRKQWCVLLFLVGKLGLSNISGVTGIIGSSMRY